MLDRQLAELAGAATVLLYDAPSRRGSEPLASSRRARVDDPADVAALARKDLRLELRARRRRRRCSLFVLLDAVVFHFALPNGADASCRAGSLGSRSCFSRRAAGVAALALEREGGALEGLVLPHRNGRDLAGKSAGGLRLLALMSSSPCRRRAFLLLPLQAQGVLGVLLANVGTALSGRAAAIAAASRTRELILPLLFLPLAIPLVVGGVGSSVSTDPAATSCFSVCTTRFAMTVLGVL